jgi:hypothetical protein
MKTAVQEVNTSVAIRTNSRFIKEYNFLPPSTCDVWIERDDQSGTWTLMYEATFTSGNKEPAEFAWASDSAYELDGFRMGFAKIMKSMQVLREIMLDNGYTEL